MLKIRKLALSRLSRVNLKSTIIAMKRRRNANVRKGQVFLTLLLVALLTVGVAVPALAKVKLTFAVWTYAIDMIEDNIKKFEAIYPDIEVELIDYDWGHYNDSIVANFFGGSTVPDILYSSDHWLQQWAAAGWVVPLEDYFPQAQEVKASFAPYAVEGMTYNGKLYGFPYFADPIALFYNEQLLKEAGFDRPAETWDELLTHLRTIKEKGIVQHPFAMSLAQDEPFTTEFYYSMVYSRGEDMYDGDEPLYNRPDSALVQTIEWIRTLLSEGLMSPDSLTDPGTVEGNLMRGGSAVYSIGRASSLASYNDPTQSRYAGHFKLARMPGTTHQTVGFARFYAMSKQVPERGPEVLEAAWKFLDYFGGAGPDGSYPVVRRWALEHGLGFAQLPLFEDAEIRASFGSWVDVDLLESISKNDAKIKQGLTPFFAEWDIFMRGHIQRGFLGQQTALQTVQNLAREWNNLK